MIGALQITGRQFQQPMHPEHEVPETRWSSLASLALRKPARKDIPTTDSAPDSVDSTELTRRLQQKDPDALEQLYELLAGRALRGVE